MVEFLSYDVDKSSTERLDSSFMDFVLRDKIKSIHDNSYAANCPKEIADKVSD
jgi:hypothetical protein